MNLKEVPNTEDFPCGHMMSENNEWEMGFYPVLFGVRVNVAKVGACGPCLSLCAGDSVSVMILVYMAVLDIMRGLDESCAEQKLLEQFPQFTVRPICRDTVNWVPFLEKHCNDQDGSRIAFVSGAALEAAPRIVGPQLQQHL